MFDLAILHLSDLHIGGEGKSISKPLNSLLADIKTQVQSIPDKKLVIAVTGDTINIGDYRALESAKTFFRKLKDIVGNRVCALYIVPGNHDKTRTPENEFLVTACRKLSDEQLSKKEIDKKDHFDQTFEKTVWPILYDTYRKSGYIDLINYHGIEIDSQAIQALTRLFISEDLQVSFDGLFEEFLETTKEFDLSSLRQQEIWVLYQYLCSFEVGYLRYDYDPEHEDGQRHPLHHLDINFSNACTYKIGLTSNMEVDAFVDLLNLETDCKYISLN